MPKEFSTWVSEMSNSIEDTSTFIKPSYDITTLTDAQRRMHIADLLVPNPETENDVDDWISAYCVVLTGEAGEKEPISGIRMQLLTLQEHLVYHHTEGDTTSKAWLYTFKEKIIKGRIR